MGSINDVLARGVQAPQFPNPLDVASKKLQIQQQQNQIQAQGLAQQSQQLDLQQKQLQMGSQTAMQQAWAQAAQQPNADPKTLPERALSIAQQSGKVLPQDVMSSMENITKYRQSIATLQKDQIANHEKNLDASIGFFNGLLNQPEDQAAAAWAPAVQAKVQSGDLTPEEGQQLGAQYPGHDKAATLVAGLRWHSAELADAKQAAETTTANSRKEQADTAQAKQAAEMPGIQADAAQKVRAQDAQALATAYKQSPAAFQQVLSQLPYGRAKQFEGLTNPDDILKVGLTPEQATTAAATAARDLASRQHQGVEENQGAQRVGIEGARLGLEKQKAGFDMNGGISPTAQMIVGGNLDPQTTRAMLRKQPGLMAQVKAADPNFDEANIENRYNTLKEFTNTGIGKAGGQALALNTLIHHADLYQQVADSLNNGSFRPGNAVYNAVATTFGKSPPTNAGLVARFLASETGKVATGGVPAEGEVNGILKNLSTSNSPEQIRDAGNTMLQIAAGRAEPLMSRAKQAKIDNVVQVLTPDSQRILQSRGFDPATMKPMQQAAGGQTGQGLKVGQTVNLKNGKTGTIKAVHPDGSFDIQ